MVEDIAEIWGDPWEFCSRLVIKDESNHIRDDDGNLRRLSNPWPEQEPWLDALFGPKKYVLGLKPRQVGYTTWTVAYLFWLLYTSQNPYLALEICHDDDTNIRLRDMVDTFRDNLPEVLRRPYRKGHDNASSSQFAHNQAGFERRIAGARGKARGWTSNYLHATEMAHWASATSATSRDDAGGSDQQMFSSALATMHARDGRVIVESTGNGPAGLFHDLWKQARTDPAWAYVFVPWSNVARYSDDLSDVEALALERDLDDTEIELVRRRGLTMGQIAWRRRKMRTEQWTPLRMRREFPLTDDEPFMINESNWFNQERLQDLLFWAPEIGDSKEPYREFHAPERGMPYFMGVDTCGGVGRDESSIQVVDIHLRHMATWNNNRASPDEQAEQASRIGQRFHRPLAVVEANNHGEQVIKRLAELGGCRLWKTEEDKDFWTTGGRAGESKRDAMVHARKLVDEQQVGIEDKETIRQLQIIVEKSNGKIEGSGDNHDDRAMGMVMAWWAAKGSYRLDRTVHETERDRIQRIRQMRTPGRTRGGQP